MRRGGVGVVAEVALGAKPVFPDEWAHGVSWANVCFAAYLHFLHLLVGIVSCSHRYLGDAHQQMRVNAAFWGAS